MRFLFTMFLILFYSVVFGQFYKLDDKEIETILQKTII
jgi:hypothetical protein